MIEVLPLSRTPTPFAGESWRGYVLRLSEQNGLDTPSRMFSHFKMNCRLTKPSTAFISALSNKPIDELDQIAYVDRSGNEQLSGHKLDKYYLNLSYPKVCSACIEEKGYIPAKWDLYHSVACETHEVWLAEYCGTCSKRLTWLRSGVGHCTCTAKISQKNGTVPRDILDLMTVIYAVLEGKQLTDSQSKTGMPFETLSALSLENLLFLIDTLGKWAMKEGSSIRSELHKLEPRHICSEAAKILSNWPHNLIDFVDNSEGFKRHFDDSDEVYYYRLYHRIFVQAQVPLELLFLFETIVEMKNLSHVEEIVKFKPANEIALLRSQNKEITMTKISARFQRKIFINHPWILSSLLKN